MTLRGSSLAGSLIGTGAVIVVYFAFIIRELVKAGRENMALGPGALFAVLFSPLFWLTAIPAFCLAYWIVAKHGQRVRS
jgi:hypothetical protein